jgi:hypothetical protein
MIDCVSLPSNPVDWRFKQTNACIILNLITTVWRLIKSKKHAMWVRIRFNSPYVITNNCCGSKCLKMNFVALAYENRTAEFHSAHAFQSTEFTPRRWHPLLQKRVQCLCILTVGNCVVLSYELLTDGQSRWPERKQNNFYYINWLSEHYKYWQNWVVRVCSFSKVCGSRAASRIHCSIKALRPVLKRTGDKEGRAYANPSHHLQRRVM